MTDCPCGSAEPYAGCCGRYHRGAAAPPTAETLMRARYSAFALGEQQFLVETWHPATRPSGPLLDDDTKDELEWLGLHVTGRDRGGLLDDTGTVSFIARYRRGGQPGRLRETSRFSRVAGRWLYTGPA